jgi:hypothetical protein
MTIESSVAPPSSCFDELAANGYTVVKGVLSPEKAGEYAEKALDWYFIILVQGLSNFAPVTET